MRQECGLAGGLNTNKLPNARRTGVIIRATPIGWTFEVRVEMCSRPVSRNLSEQIVEIERERKSSGVPRRGKGPQNHGAEAEPPYLTRRR